MGLEKITAHLTEKSWLDILNKSLTYNNIHNGHTYLYVNKSGKVQEFINNKLAAKQSFKHKLTVDQIVLISRHFFGDYKKCSLDTLLQLKHTYLVIQRGTEKSWVSRFIHFFRGLGFRTSFQLIDQEILLSKDQMLTRAPQDLIVQCSEKGEFVQSLNQLETYEKNYVENKHFTAVISEFYKLESAGLDYCDQFIQRPYDKTKNLTDSIKSKTPPSLIKANEDNLPKVIKTIKELEKHSKHIKDQLLVYSLLLEVKKFYEFLEINKFLDETDLQEYKKFETDLHFSAEQLITMPGQTVNNFAEVFSSLQKETINLQKKLLGKFKDDQEHYDSLETYLKSQKVCIYFPVELTINPHRTPPLGGGRKLVNKNLKPRELFNQKAS